MILQGNRIKTTFMHFMRHIQSIMCMKAPHKKVFT